MNLLDKIIGYISPSAGLSRVQARATMKQIESFVGGTNSGYNAGKINRMTRGRGSVEVKEHALPQEQFQRLIADSWNLYRNNPYARKIVRSITSKVIGKGLTPESQALRPDGTAHTEFRQRCKLLWKRLNNGFDFRGMPGQGGLNMPQIQHLALRSCILSGDSFGRLVPIDAAEMMRRDIPVPVVWQPIDKSRLADEHDLPAGAIADNGMFYRGLELDVTGRVRAYWINAIRPGEISPAFTSAKRRPATEINHVFIEDDVDQYLGTPWFASALLNMRDTNDLQYNVLKQSAMAACVVLGYRKPTGAGPFGLQASRESVGGTADGTDLTDEDGNVITKVQPGMFVNLGKDGELQGFSPNIQNANPESFVSHMLRGTAGGFPGLKASTVTGDYRNSSFSSERSADNDAWPEIEAMQDWFSNSFCQPIWDQVIRSAIMVGFFEGVISADEFAEEPWRFTETKWQGPIQQSINPIDDVEAAARRVKYGQSSLQLECAKRNVNWQDVLTDAAELYEVAQAKSLPPEVINNILGIGAEDVVAQVKANQQEQPQETVNA